MKHFHHFVFIKVCSFISILNFCQQKIVLIRFCKSPSKLWRSSQTFTLFLAMTFVSLTIVIATLLFVLTQWVKHTFSRQFLLSYPNSMNDFNFRIKVSQACGPLHTHGYMFEVLRADILKLQEVGIQ